MTRPACKYCGKPSTSSGRSKDGKRKWKTVCSPCHKNEWSKYRKNKCEFCGFVPVHVCQLDVDHKDGNKSNNNTDNLQTLCSNCHRLKTFLSKDWNKDNFQIPLL